MMQRKRQVRNSKKRNPGRGTLRNTPLKMNRELIVAPVPDRTIARLRQILVPENLFLTAQTVDGSAFYMNSIFEAKSGTNFQAPYLSGFAIFYRKYRVIRSSVLFTFASREATKQICCAVSPASGATVASSITTFQDLTSLPFAKHVNVGPISSGNNIAKIRISIKPEKLIGPHYNQQDEYGGTPGANPSTLLYWQVAAYCTDAMTITTGGVQVTAQLEQTIEYYEPDRDNTVGYLKQPTTVPEIDQIMGQMAQQRSKLTRSTSR